MPLVNVLSNTFFRERSPNLNITEKVQNERSISLPTSTYLPTYRCNTLRCDIELRLRTLSLPLPLPPPSHISLLNLTFEINILSLPFSTAAMIAACPCFSGENINGWTDLPSLS